MAHHAEPMDIDDETDFDNKENTYHHTNVLPKTPCTEKGYEELDVSELNMKLRYSITPTASPMSKSMSNCLDNRYNVSTDESQNNTIINEYENNLTRSLNSTLIKSEVKSPKLLPLQALTADNVDSVRSTSVFRPLDSTVTANDITITVSNENDLDNLSFPSSSSSMAHTPEAATPTKEIPKHDGGSPIMRGLKSVLSMFRSSQSPIPPGDDETKAIDAASRPADVPRPESKLQAVASTPMNNIDKEKSISRRNSPLKESIIFNEDLEKELNWSDDSTIVFSSEKIPIRKLFFQEKPSKPALLKENVKQEDADSTVEYMDVSYNDLSIRDRTLNCTANKSKVSEMGESDGEFVDCETTFTQNEVDSNKEELDASKTNYNQVPNVPAQELVGYIEAISEPCKFNTTKDIIDFIDSTQIAVGDLEKQVDFSTTALVNQLSDLINEETNVTVVKNIDTIILGNTEPLKVNEVQIIDIVQPESTQNQVTSPVNVNSGDNSSVSVAEQVSITNENSIFTPGIDSDIIATYLESVETKISSVPVDADALYTREVCPQILEKDETKSIISPAGTNDSGDYPSPVDIPLPNDDDVNEINDILLEDIVHSDLQDKTMLVRSTSLNAFMSEATHDIQRTQLESKVIACPSNLLSSDVPLPTDDPLKTVNMPHESMTVVINPMHSFAAKNPDANFIDVCSFKVDIIDENVDKSITKATTGTLCEQTEPDNINSDVSRTCSLSPMEIPLATIEDNDTVRLDKLPGDALTVGSESVQQYDINTTEIISDENGISKTELFNEPPIDKTVKSITNKVKIGDVVTVKANMPTDYITPEKEENMELSFVAPANNNFSGNLTMDVSMVDTNVNVTDTFNQPVLGQEETELFNDMPQLTKVTPNVAAISADIVTAENLSEDKAHKQESDQIESDSKVEGTTSKENVHEPVFVPEMSKDLSINDKSNSSATLIENVDVSVGLKIYSDAEPLFDSNKIDIVSSSVLENCNLPTLPKIFSLEKEGSKDKHLNESKHNNEYERVSNIVGDLNVISSEQDLPTPEIPNEIDKSDIKNNTSLQEPPKSSDVTLNLDLTHNVENASKCEEKVDEEIILSESNSPFVSMSAEEEFDPESKKDFEDIESQFSIKSKVTQSPPPSPKIVSKGYNFNFDDIDNINPFATKAKIRQSPPPSPSPNTSLATEDIDKTKIVEPLKSETNINRRKSMPERKKPLKAKRHLNATFDSAECAPSQKTASKISVIKMNAKAEPEQEKSEANRIDVVGSSSLNVDQEKVEIEPHKEPEPKPDEGDPNEELTIKDETITVLKPDTTSSSEQSTYFSAGASSTELTDSKNVFNLPELDDFNPFATKSKIRQSPPRDLDTDNSFVTKNRVKSSPETSFLVTQKDPNCTVTINNEIELKQATCNLSTGSGSSMASEEKDVTVHEVHTEDEDTLEGPFLETDDADDGVKPIQLTEEKVNMVDLDNLNQQENEEAPEMFIDAEAFEFLMNQNKSDEVAYSGKESLFLKFDPLFARRVTLEGVSAALSEIKRKQSTPKKAPKPPSAIEEQPSAFEMPVAGPSDINNTHEVQNVVDERPDEINITVTKPIMAVTPAVNPVVTPRTSLTPNRSNRLSMTFTSPAMAVIDRLLSLSGNSPSASLDATVTHVDRTHNEADQALTQLRELLAEKEINVYNLRCESKELRSRLTILESQMKTLEAESAERLRKVNELNENLAEKTKMNRKMAAVVEEYERTIASLISETEQDKNRFAEERDQLIRERDEQTAHLASMEVSFNDLHSKYEKSKQVIIGYKANEDAYKKSILEFEDNLSKMHSNYELLKQHATAKLNHANQELEKINKAHEGEVLKLNAMIKRKELHITSLEESLAQKIKANEELTAICDELINKVG